MFSDRLCETAFPPSTGWRGSTRAITAFTPPRAGTCRGERRLRNLMDLHGRDDSHHVPPAHIRLLAWVTVHAGRKAQGAITPDSGGEHFPWTGANHLDHLPIVRDHLTAPPRRSDESGGDLQRMGRPRDSPDAPCVRPAQIWTGSNGYSLIYLSIDYKEDSIMADVSIQAHDRPGLGCVPERR